MRSSSWRAPLWATSSATARSSSASPVRYRGDRGIDLRVPAKTRMPADLHPENGDRAAPRSAEEGGRQRPQGGLGSGPEMADGLGRRERAEPPARDQVPPVCEAVEEAGRVLITRARRVAEAVHGYGVDHVHLVARADHRATLPPGERGDVGVSTDALQRVVEVVEVVQRADLLLVREQHLDGVLDEVEKLVTMAMNAEWVGEGERDPAARAVRNRGRLPERVLGRRLIEQVALEVGDLGPCDERLVDVVRLQVTGHAEKCAHRAFGVGSDDDVAAAGRTTAVGARRTEAHAERLQVVREHPTELVGADLPD